MNLKIISSRPKTSFAYIPQVVSWVQVTYTIKLSLVDSKHLLYPHAIYANLCCEWWRCPDKCCIYRVKLHILFRRPRLVSTSSPAMVEDHMEKKQMSYLWFLVDQHHQSWSALASYLQNLSSHHSRKFGSLPLISGTCLFAWRADLCSLLMRSVSDLLGKILHSASSARANVDASYNSSLTYSSVLGLLMPARRARSRQAHCMHC